MNLTFPTIFVKKNTEINFRDKTKHKITTPKTTKLSNAKVHIKIQTKFLVEKSVKNLMCTNFHVLVKILTI